MKDAAEIILRTARAVQTPQQALILFVAAGGVVLVLYAVPESIVEKALRLL